MPETITSEQKDFTTSFDYFITFVNNWENIDSLKQLKALILYEDNHSEIIDVPLIESIPIGKEISKIDTKFLLDKTKGASEIVLAENSPFNKLIDNKNIKKILKDFRDQAHNNYPKLSHYLVMSPYNYYSYNVSDL